MLTTDYVAQFSTGELLQDLQILDAGESTAYGDHGSEYVRAALTELQCRFPATWPLMLQMLEVNPELSEAEMTVLAVTAVRDPANPAHMDVSAEK